MEDIQSSRYGRLDGSVMFTIIFPAKIMKTRSFISLLFCLFFACNAFSAPILHKKIITNFYVWYIDQCEKIYRNKEVKDPLYNDEIFKYVSKELVLGLRAERENTPEGEVGNRDSDYFFKAQDYDAINWPKNINFTPIHDIFDMMVVGVSLVGTDRSFTQKIIVVLRKEGDEWKIFKVLSTQYWMD